MFELLIIAVLSLAFAKGKKAVVAYQDREQRWHEANGEQRERIVREECGWRILGRVAASGGLAVGAFVVASPALAVMWGLAAWRLLKPIKEEMRDAASYHSTGRSDEPPYSW
jgi:hypothetical protein